MAAPLRPLNSRGFDTVVAAAVAAGFGLPLAGAVGVALAEGWHRPAFAALATDPRWGAALVLSAGTGAEATFFSLLLALVLVAGLHGWTAGGRLLGRAAGALAVPHAALAIGLALLLMPAGLLARLLAPLAGWDLPPTDWVGVNDPAGIALVAGLVLKETPFLVWSLGMMLARPDVRLRLDLELRTCATLGCSRAAAWWTVLWPQWLPRLGWPLLAVWAYGATTVDMAQILGPGTPPTAAVLAWQWLTDADAERNRQGAAAALVLAGVVAGGALLARVAWSGLRRGLVAWAVSGRARPAGDGGALASGLLVALTAAMGVAALLLLPASAAGLWSFPDLLPQRWSGAAWQALVAGPPVLANSALLAAAAALASVLIAVAWLEASPVRWDRPASVVLLLPLLLPSVLLAPGLYRLLLGVDLDGRFAGLWIAHLMFCVPYAWIALAPAYRSIDPRLAATAQTLGRSRAAFLLRVKWPLLAPPIAAAGAVAFAVSIGQYLPTQFVGAGRFPTVTTEAVTLAAGGQRAPAAAAGLVQALLPALVFLLAARVGRRSVADRAAA